jgi:DNA repair exonuclease SbcCD ATPase subunit
LYGITSHPSGFLQRRANPISATDPVAEGNGALAPDPLELAPAGEKTLLERRVEELNIAVRQRDAELARLAQQLEDPERVGEYDRLQRQLVDAEQRLAAIPDLELQIEELESQLRRLNRAAADTQEEIKKLHDRLTANAQVLSDVFNSPSWRVTKPLRQAKRLVKGAS